MHRFAPIVPLLALVLALPSAAQDEAVERYFLGDEGGGKLGVVVVTQPDGATEQTFAVKIEGELQFVGAMDTPAADGGFSGLPLTMRMKGFGELIVVNGFEEAGELHVKVSPEGQPTEERTFPASERLVLGFSAMAHAAALPFEEGAELEFDYLSVKMEFDAGTRLVYTGTGEVDGTACHVVEQRTGAGTVEDTYYLDDEHRILRMEHMGGRSSMRQVSRDDFESLLPSVAELRDRIGAGE
ncbi:hypothetical protein OAX78_03675 [Planctomycetota bacterium]|nr:hypothetical protein [Planctomycetota bacterium]